MKLFGLLEEMHISFFFTYHVPVTHEELFKHLEQYGPGVSVGLELSSDKKEHEVGLVKFITPDVHMELLEYFKRKGSTTHFLESEEFYQRAGEIGNEMVALDKEVRKEQNTDKRQGILQTLDERAIEFEYLTKVAKEERILESIARTKPDLVFLGAAHSARFYRDQQRLREKYGITIDEYWEDEITKQTSQEDLMHAMGASSEHTPTEMYLEGTTQVRPKRINSPEEATDDIQSMCIERLYKAVKEGRVTDGTPDFIGTWDLNLEHRGLFELFVQERTSNGQGTQIKGVIEDCNGSARFEGTTESRYIKFTKIYAQATHHAAKGDIVYEGNDPLGNGEYGGAYYGAHCGKGPFKMKKFVPQARPARAQP